MKFVLLVEGFTETDTLRDFLGRWFSTQALSQKVGVQPVNLKGSAHFVDEVETKAALYLNEPHRANDIIAVIGLLDLYGLPVHFRSRNPSWQTQSVQQRYEWAKKTIEQSVNQPRFRQFFAVHETEAWLLSDSANRKFPPNVKKALQKHPKIARPEEINFDKPPAKLLDELYQTHANRSYKKKVDGANLFAELDPNIAYGKCPKLKEMLDEMLALARAAGL